MSATQKLLTEYFITIHLNFFRRIVLPEIESLTKSLISNTTIIFNHVPKTGGTSIIHFFEDLFGENRCYRHRSKDSETNTYTPAIDALPEEERAKLRFVGGHFGYGI